MTTKKKTQPKVTQRDLQEAIIRELHIELFLSEIASYTAVRSLKIKAQEAALKFEESIVKELGLVHPDKMDELSQQVYHQATTKLMDALTSSVVDAVQALEGLPKEVEVNPPVQEPQHAKVTY